MLLAPIVKERKGEHVKTLANLASQGYIRARIDGDVCDLSDPPALDLHKKHTIEVVVDRFKVRDDLQLRLAEFPALAQQAVHQRGLTMVDVSNNHEVANVVAPHRPASSPGTVTPRTRHAVAECLCRVPVAEDLGYQTRQEPAGEQAATQTFAATGLIPAGHR